jgi:hypothetical protein
MVKVGRKKNKSPRVYIWFMNVWWSVPYPEYLMLCEQAMIDGGAFELKEEWELKQKPKCIRAYRTEDDSRWKYWTEEDLILVTDPETNSHGWEFRYDDAIDKFGGC